MLNELFPDFESCKEVHNVARFIKIYQEKMSPKCRGSEANGQNQPREWQLSSQSSPPISGTCSGEHAVRSYIIGKEWT
jgi:hypothetical protein